MKPAVRLAIIIHGYYPRIGGAERLVGAMAPRLQALGFEVHILTRRLPNTRSYELIAGVPVYRLPVPGAKVFASLSFTTAALQRLSSIRPQVMHAHELFSPTTTAVLAQAFTGIPVVATPHSSGIIGDVERMQRRWMGPQRLALFRRRVNAFVTISKDIDDELAGVGVPREKRFAIANGVDEQRFVPPSPDQKNLLRSQLDLPADALVGVFCGRLAPEKRVDQLVLSWAKVRERYPQAILLIVGTGVEEERIQRLAGEGVVFKGAAEDVVPFLQSADLYCLPSVREGLSVSILESQACGLPVAASRIPGNMEIITPGKNGLLFDPDQPAALQTALLELLSSAPLRRQLGETGRARVLERYTLTQTVERHAELYRQLLTSKGTR